MGMYFTQFKEHFIKSTTCKGQLQSFRTGAKASIKAGCTETQKSMEFEGLD